MKKIELQNLALDMGIKSNILDLIILKETKLSKTELFILQEIEDKYTRNIIVDLEKYKSGIPIEYILEKAEFYSLDFFVDNRTLIPRNDTEIMVDKAIEEIISISPDTETLEEENKKNITYIDVGTGTSCIAISTLLNTSKIDNGFVIDISDKALEVSYKNIITHNLEKKITQINGDLLHDFLGNNDYKLNKNIVITANLPYIKDNDHENMDKETVEFEPDLALYGGKETGFELYEKLISQAQKLKELNHIKKITLFIEIGFDQKEYSEKYLTELGLKHNYFKDNGGIDRCIRIEI